MQRIIQISDLHIPGDGKARFNIPIAEQFDLILDEIGKEHFDTLVISGDLAFKEGSGVIYSIIREKLASICKPVLFMPGNHDDGELMRKYFPIRSESKSAIYFSQTFLFDEILFLDTSTNQLSGEQFEWLKQKASGHDKRLVLFIHHPVLNANVSYMDTNHYLQNRDDIKEFLLTLSIPVYIFCGHYHTDTVTVEQNITQAICPSNYYLIDTNSMKFAIESVKTGYRVIEFTENSISTRSKTFDL